MNKNDYQDLHGNDEEIVKFNFPIADLMYTHGFRKRLEAARIQLEADPNAETKSTGILIVSDNLKEGLYAIQTSMFGSINNIINTLSHVLIEKLKDGAGSERAVREHVLTDFMSFFFNEAKATLFKEFENDEESE